jgi:dipeptidyl aminopeptidase/acylaminoacyl peptidase
VVISILAGVTFVLPLRAGDEKPAAAESKKTPWKAEDVIFTESAGQFRISPDCKWVVWVKNVADKEKDRSLSTMYLTSLTEKKEIQLTYSEDAFVSPQWSPSGEIISFLSSRPVPKPKPGAPTMQLWLMNKAGGEAWPVTDFIRGIQEYEWIDQDTILFVAQEEPSLYEQKLKEDKDDSNAVDDEAHVAPVRLFKFSIKTKKVTRLTDNADRMSGLAVSHDHKHAVITAQRELSYAWDQKLPPVSYLIGLTSGQTKQVDFGPKVTPLMPIWARDNSGLYFMSQYSDDPRFQTATIQKMQFYDLVSGKTTEVNLDWDRGAGEFQVTNDGFITLMPDGVYHKAARYTRHGSTWSHEWIGNAEAKNYGGVVLGQDDHTLLYDYSTASTPTQWFRARLDGTTVSAPVQITDINPLYKNKVIAKSEVIHWKGANNEEVEGLLFYPHNYEAGKRYPLVVATHGGPAGADADSWSESWAYSSNLMTQRGAFVLKTNYHGSSSYGLKWVESICCGKYYDLEIPDIEKGVDNLIAKGLVDKDKIGAMGWSNGSILSIQLSVTNPDRYKAISVGAGDVEWISDWANVDFGESFDHYYFGKSMLEDPQFYLKKSPVFKMDKVKSATLIFFGTEDRAVPTDQGWTHYRALYTIGKVPVKFILFPGEGHGPARYVHQLRKVNEELAWFDKYLFHINPPENEAFKKGSPLDTALKLRSVQKDDGLYGTHAGTSRVLVPEVVKRNDLEIGRFEVTRAQFSAFQSSYQFPAGTGNYPANGIGFDQAKAYCEWLSGRTGQTFRLPNENEVTSLYADHPGENTLDYWAGYAINPEDSQRLDAKIKDLPGNAPLLREVGSFPGQGGEDEDLIFDLAGNVAEWVIASDGSGKTLGGSADRAADSKARYRAADLQYTGFRVVRGAAKPK